MLRIVAYQPNGCQDDSWLHRTEVRKAAIPAATRDRGRSAAVLYPQLRSKPESTPPPRAARSEIFGSRGDRNTRPVGGISWAIQAPCYSGPEPRLARSLPGRRVNGGVRWRSFLMGWSLRLCKCSGRRWRVVSSSLPLRQRWVRVGRRECGGCAPEGGVRPRRGGDLKGRCLTFAEREGIAVARAGGESMRSIARRLGRSLSTISRELARNADRAGCYRATSSHALAYVRASRPKPSKLATNLELRRNARADGHERDRGEVRVQAEEHEHRPGRRPERGQRVHLEHDFGQPGQP